MALAAAGTVVAVATNLKKLRDFLKNCRDGADLENITKKNFIHYTYQVQDALQLYESVKDKVGEGDTFEAEVLRMQKRLADVMKEADEKYEQTSRAKLLLGMPLVFFKEHSAFFEKWLKDNQYRFEKYEVKRQELRKEEFLSMPDFADIDALGRRNEQVQSILNCLNELDPGDIEDLKILEDLQTLPDTISKYEQEPIVQALRTAASKQDQLFMVGSTVSVNERKGKIMWVQNQEDYPFHYGVLLEDTTCTTCSRWDWFNKAQVKLEKWGPQLEDIKRACSRHMGQLGKETGSIYDLRALAQVMQNPRLFIKYYQHKETLVRLLESFFQSEIQVLLKQEEHTTYLFLGNPGSGKSTLLNGLVYHYTGIQEAVFDSGFSEVSGKTQILQIKQSGNNRFGDTPGLKDKKRIEQCAAEIEASLQEGGNYKPFFVVQLAAGRIKDEDWTTMTTILKAAPTMTTYGVIINGTAESRVKAMRQAREESPLGEAWVKYDAELNMLPRKPIEVEFVPFAIDLHDTDNVVKSLPHEVLAMIQRMPTIRLEKEDVRSLDIRNLDDLLQERKKEIEEMAQLNIDRIQAESAKRELDMQRLQEQELQKMHQQAEEKTNRMQAELEAEKEKYRAAHGALKQQLKEDYTKQMEDAMESNRKEWERQQQEILSQREKRLQDKLSQQDRLVQRLQVKPFMSNPDNPVVFFDVTLQGVNQGRVYIELFKQTAPKMTENFRQLCIGGEVLEHGSVFSPPPRNTGANTSTATEAAPPAEGVLEASERPAAEAAAAAPSAEAAVGSRLLHYKGTGISFQAFRDGGYSVEGGISRDDNHAGAQSIYGGELFDPDRISSTRKWDRDCVVEMIPYGADKRVGSAFRTERHRFFLYHNLNNIVENVVVPVVSPVLCMFTEMASVGQVVKGMEVWDKISERVRGKVPEIQAVISDCGEI